MADASATTPRVAVVVPTYQRAAMLDRLLRAIADVRAPDGGFEVVVVDDGSTDATAAVAANAGSDVRYLRQQNAGPAAARNRGWRSTNAEIVVFTDDDCVPEPDWLTSLVDCLDRRSDLVGVGGDIQPLTDGFIASFVQAERLVHHGADDRGVRYLVTANAAFRRSVLESMCGFDERFPGAVGGEDTDLSFRLRAAGGVLGVTHHGRVRHDHRVTGRGLFDTYRKHGRGRPVLAELHPDASVGAAARSMLGPRYWMNRYRYYRRSVGVARGLAYTGMRFMGLVSYSVGIIEGRRRST